MDPQSSPILEKARKKIWDSGFRIVEGLIGYGYESGFKFVERQIGYGYESGFKFVGSQIGYIINCNQNIKKLRAESGNLRAEKKTVEGRVKRARDNAEEIEHNVSNWLSEAGDVVEEVDQFLAKEGLGADGAWVRGRSIFKRRRLGKEAEDKLKDVAKLIERGKFGSVGHRTPQTLTLLFTSATDSQYFRSRASIFDQIMDALKDDSVYLIGIYGMAGVGKTTMVDQVSNQAKDLKLFDDFAKAVASQTPDYAKIRRDLAACLNLTLDNKSQVQDAALLYNRLKNGKKILVIIDDVWDPIELEKIGIPSRDYIKGCKILFTSRKRDVYVKMDVQKQFPIEVLSESEASSLFQIKVGNTIDDSHEIRPLAEQVCRECGGLPLAIVTLGAALKGKNLYAWNDTLNQLKSGTATNIDGVTAGVYLPIKLSYNFLQHTDTKACFLYCSLYPEDEEISIEDLVWHGVGRRFLSSWHTVEDARQRVWTIVDTLKTSCLLLEGRNEYYVRMHDIVRDVALSIAEKDTELKLFVRSGGVQQWPRKYELVDCRTFAVWDRELPNVLECPELRTLVMRDNYRWFELTVHQSFFKVTEKLEVLYLQRLQLSASISSISKLVNIRVLCLYDLRFENLSFLKELKELEMLRICAYGRVALTSEVGKLTQLRVLDLRQCYKLVAVSAGIVSRLSKLEELYLPVDFYKWGREGNASLEELNSLHYLHILHIHLVDAADAKALLLLHEPRCWSLIEFRISVGYCDQYDGFGDAYSETINTRTLRLKGIDLTGQPMVLMTKAETCTLIEPIGLQKLFEERQRKWFLDLEFLGVRDCNDETEHGFLLGKPKWNNQEIIEGVGPSSFGRLKVLKVHKCGFKYLFSRSVVRGFSQLETLEIVWCDSMEGIVGDDDIDEQFENDVLVFSQLKKLKLSYLRNLKCFYANAKTKSTPQPLFNQKVSFPALEELTVHGLDNIAVVWNIQSGAVDFPCLRELRISGGFEFIIVIVSTAPTLQDRQEREQDMVILPELLLLGLSQLPKVKNFCSFISNEKKMKEDKNLQVNAFFSHKVKLPCLDRLYLSDIPGLTKIWDVNASADTFGKLKVLEIQSCNKLANVAPSKLIESFHGLRELIVKCCLHLEEIFGSVEASNEIEDKSANEIEKNLLFPQLERVLFYNLPKLGSFCSRCSTSKVLSSVTKVEINGCPILEKELANDNIKWI